MDLVVAVQNDEKLRSDWLKYLVFHDGTEKFVQSNLRPFFRNIVVSESIIRYHTMAHPVGVDLLLEFLRAYASDQIEMDLWRNNRWLALAGNLNKLTAILNAAMTLGVNELIDFFFDEMRTLMTRQNNHIWMATLAAQYYIHTGQIDN